MNLSLPFLFYRYWAIAVPVYAAISAVVFFVAIGAMNLLTVAPLESSDSLSHSVK